jgi:hypothetical protein
VSTCTSCAPALDRHPCARTAQQTTLARHNHTETSTIYTDHTLQALTKLRVKHAQARASCQKLHTKAINQLHSKQEKAFSSLLCSWLIAFLGARCGRDGQPKHAPGAGRVTGASRLLQDPARSPLRATLGYRHAPLGRLCLQEAPSGPKATLL